MSVSHHELVPSALRRAGELDGRNLINAALQLAERDERMRTLLLQPVPNPVQNGANNVPLENSSRRDFMCPDLYRATVSGCVHRVNELLGLVEQMTHIHDRGQDVTVLLGGTHETKEKGRQWGHRIHGDSLCTLQEVTAEKNTVLHIAAEHGHAELVEKIIHRDHTLLISENSRNETPLHLAARTGRCSVVALIVFLAQESGIGAYEALTMRSAEGDTVLHEAARHGHEDVVHLLMTVAPALSAEFNNASISPLYIAAVRNSAGIVKALLEHSRPSTIGPNHQNALHAAVQQSQEIMSMLLDWKAELANERDDSGNTPMHYAASSGDLTVVKVILDKAPLSVYIQDQEGSSPLHVASRMGHYSVLRCMIEHCPDSFEVLDNHGQNFLHIVGQNDGGEVYLNHHNLKNVLSIINLVASSPDLKKLVNQKDNEGNTPLHCASMNGFSETIFHLLRTCKADITLINNAGDTALDHAVSQSNFFLVARTTATLSAYGATLGPGMRDKMKNWRDETSKWIDKTSKNLIIVSVLVATIAFSAAFNVPGSYNGVGVANLRQRRQYKIFIILDTIAMSASVSSSILLLLARAVNKSGSWSCFCYALLFLWISLFTMQYAFVVALFQVLGEGKKIIKFAVSSIPGFFYILIVTAIYMICSPAKLGTIGKFLFPAKKQSQRTLEVTIQLPKVASYIKIAYWFIFLSSLLYLVMIVMILLK